MADLMEGSIAPENPGWQSGGGLARQHAAQGSVLVHESVLQRACDMQPDQDGQRVAGNLMHLAQRSGEILHFGNRRDGEKAVHVDRPAAQEGHQNARQRHDNQREQHGAMNGPGERQLPVCAV